MTADPRLDLRALLDAGEGAPPSAGIDALATELAATIRASEVTFLIADMSGGALTRLARATASGGSELPRNKPTTVPIVGSVAGLALSSQQLQLLSSEAGVWVYVPVTERGEPLGVLELLLAEPPDPGTLGYLRSAAHALSYIVIADQRHSDLYECGQRTEDLTLEAEIQRRLLPPSYSCQAEQFALAGWLVPANQVGGDTFDYIVDRDTLHLSITDAMGHGVAAAQLATLAVGSLRNSRRSGAGLVEQAQQANLALATHAAPDQFVTAQLLQIDMRTGATQIVNAGHMSPLLVRDGTVRVVELDVDLILGVLPDTLYRVQHLQLLPNDRLVLLTDGMYEREAAEAEIELLLGTLDHLHPRAAAQALTAAVLNVCGGAIRDDATVLLLDWYGTQHQSMPQGIAGSETAGVR